MNPGWYKLVNTVLVDLGALCLQRARKGERMAALGLPKVDLAAEGGM